jgi:hypothetical protein
MTAAIDARRPINRTVRAGSPSVFAGAAALGCGARPKNPTIWGEHLVEGEKHDSLSKHYWVPFFHPNLVGLCATGKNLVAFCTDDDREVRV